MFKKKIFKKSFKKSGKYPKERQKKSPILVSYGTIEPDESIGTNQVRLAGHEGG